MLESASETAAGVVPRVVLAPHAGYVYSGAVAAHAYGLLGDDPPAVVVLIGPSHFEPFRFSSVFSGAGYETPLGVVAADRETAIAIVDRIAISRD